MPDLHPIEAWIAKNPGERSKSKLAKAIKRHPSRVTQICNGGRPDPDVAAAIEKITGIDARVLLGIPKVPTREARQCA